MSGDPVERDTNNWLARMSEWERRAEDVRESALREALKRLRAHCDHVEPPADGKAPKEVGLADDVIDQYAYYLWETEKTDSVQLREEFAEDLATEVESAFADSDGEYSPHWRW